MTGSPRLDRAGLPAQSDLDDPALRALYEEMSRYQDEFLERIEPTRSADYKWPRDALNWWSRRWEYPYVLHHLRAAAPRTVLDIGPGVCFFPFFLASQGIDVSACDIDPQVVGDFTKAAEACGQAERARCVEGPIDALPFPDEAFDLIYCISVVEHIPFKPDLFDDVVRVVRPGGRLLLTMDVALEGKRGVSRDHCRTYTAAIEQHFRPVFPIDWTEPAEPIQQDRALRGNALGNAARRVRRTLGKEYSRMSLVGMVYERR